MFLALLVPSLGYCPPPIPADPYTQFLTYCWKHSKRWNPNLDVKTVEWYAWTTWDGVGADPDMAKDYFHVSIQETGMRCLYNEAGAGFSGATWAVITKALKSEGIKCPQRSWVKSHPAKVNRAIAAYFSIYMQERPIWKWHNSEDPKKNIWYQKRVKWIETYCSKN